MFAASRAGRRRWVALCCAMFLTGSALADARETVDVIIAGDFVVTVNPDDEVIEQGAVAVRDGSIVAVGREAQITARYQAARTIPGGQRVLLPGLINGHTHMAMTLFRGLADDLRLMEWLNDHMFPAEVAFADADFVRAGTALACWEMLRGGTTTAVDMYYFPNVVAEVIADCGMRAVVAATVIGQPSPDAKTPAQALRQARAFIEKWRGHPRVVPALGPHAIYTTAPETLLKVRDTARELHAPLSIHMAESRSENTLARDRYGKPTVSLLEEVGFFDQQTRFIAAHMVWPTPQEMATLARYGVGAVHNPTSNMKITAGIAPVQALQQAGVAVGLGTDGAASNNDLDMWEEMRLATLLAKISLDDATALPAAQVLRMATIDGARAIGMDNQLGSIEAGKQADLIQLSLSGAHMLPLYNVISHLVYTAKSSDVTTVLVQGVPVVEAGEVTTIDTDAITSDAQAYRRRIAERAR